MSNIQILKSFIVNESGLRVCGAAIKSNVKSTFNECLDSLPNLEITNLDNDYFKIDSVIDYLHDELNTGHWSQVPLELRKLFTVCSFVKVLLMLHKSNDDVSLKKALKTVDVGLLLGAPLDDNPDLLLKTASFLTKKINSSSVTSEFVLHKKRKSINLNSFDNEKSKEVESLRRPSLETFHRDCLQMKRPMKLQGCMDHWAAMEKWKDVNYILSVAGERTVPIEIGSHYANEDWGQTLMTVRQFVENHFVKDSAKLGYLAQHNLFDQVSELREDIHVPEYCCLSSDEEPDINAWLGPAGTVSPLHHDPKNNILAQVFGTKHVVLFAASDTPYLYPHEERLLSNTARVDPLHPDLETYPLFSHASPLHCLLGPGEMLFIPAGTWHHVSALTHSFSVSFWWR